MSPDVRANEPSPSVTVIIPVYNAAATIERALASVFAQSHPAHEILCVDDCSTDHVADIITQLAARHPQLRLLRAPRNLGPGHARNLGVAAASGDWLAMLDADDAWRPRRLERMLAIARQQQADMVMDNLILHKLESGEDLRLGFSLPQAVNLIDPEQFWHNCQFGRLPYSLFKPLIRRSFLAQHGIRYIDDLRFGEDLILYAELLQAGARTVVTAAGDYIYSLPTGTVGDPDNLAIRPQWKFARLVEAIDAFQARHQGLAPATRAAVQHCANSLRRTATGDHARTLKAKGDWLGYLAIMLRPEIARHALSHRLRARMARKTEAQLRQTLRPGEA